LWENGANNRGWTASHCVLRRKPRRNAALLFDLSALSTRHDDDVASMQTFLISMQTNAQFYIQCLKNFAKLFLSELRQISTNFDNFWQKDGKE